MYIVSWGNFGHGATSVKKSGTFVLLGMKAENLKLFLILLKLKLDFLFEEMIASIGLGVDVVLLELFLCFTQVIGYI